MRQAVIIAAIPLAFVAGLLANDLAPTAHAQAQAPALQPQIINLGAMTDAEIGDLVPNIGTLRTRTLVVQPEGTIAIQSGDVPRHTHSDANEIQYIIAGSGTAWLGDQQRQIRAGDLIIIPKGTVHAGSVSGNDRLKVLAIKLPPQRAGDMHLVP
jgi:quercetin dioxygenase-like cupin family protein